MRVRTLSRRLGSTALVIALGLSVAACGSDGSDDNTPDGSDETSQTDTGEEAEGEELSELAAADFYPAVTAALKDAETFKYTATSTAAGAESTMTGEARYTDSGVEMRATSDGAQAMEMVMLDQVVYMKSPDMGMGDKWLKIDLKTAGDSLFGMLAKATDPEAMFKAMEAPKKVELLGQEEIDGVETNHYRVTIDPTNYMEAMGFPAEMATYMPKELVTDMWVDGDNLPRKYAQDVSTPAAGGQPASKSSTEGFYTDFGTDVEIEAPPASEVTDQIPGMPGAA
ncbi:hypothetical protein EXE58_04825 [Nocardioides seonyuensis]|uniref:LppX_LprAFG lipoprotein n=1 Tax=Nocardioides seonyuensis TaxID=2518371 RepID=A0A4P7ICN8_9ACTN|nr:hypothetical protein [Nocardioides seonyuensis]QBX54856.1 hypothetical protein EXE58_04825 [Nocardioides seonyuensis]